MKSKFVSTVPAIALIMAGSLGFAWADTSEVKLPSPVIVEKPASTAKTIRTASIDIIIRSSPPPMSLLGSFSFSRPATHSIPT